MNITVFCLSENHVKGRMVLFYCKLVHITNYQVYVFYCIYHRMYSVRRKTTFEFHCLQKLSSCHPNPWMPS